MLRIQERTQELRDGLDATADRIGDRLGAQLGAAAGQLGAQLDAGVERLRGALLAAAAMFALAVGVIAAALLALTSGPRGGHPYA